MTHQAARIRRTAQAIASLDVLSSLAEVAAVNNYTKPRLHTGFDLQIRQGQTSRNRSLESRALRPQ